MATWAERLAAKAQRQAGITEVVPLTAEEKAEEQETARRAARRPAPGWAQRIVDRVQAREDRPGPDAA